MSCLSIEILTEQIKLVAEKEKIEFRAKSMYIAQFVLSDSDAWIN